MGPGWALAGGAGACLPELAVSSEEAAGPHRTCLHLRHESLIQPTPTRMRGARPLTLEPTALTMPTTSWPGMKGKPAARHGITC